MSWLSYVLVFLGLMGCSPGTGVDKTDGGELTDDAPVDTNVVVDTDSDTPKPDTGDTGEIALVNIAVSLSGPVICAEPGLRETEGPWDVRFAYEMPMEIDRNLIGSGLVLADFDLNQHLDVFVVGDDEFQLWMQTEDGNFIDQADTALLGLHFEAATACSAADYDNDGDFDLIIAGYNERNHLLMNNGYGAFSDVTAAAGLWEHEPLKSVSSSWGDMDRDGDLDLIIGNYGPHPENAYLPQGGEFEQGDRSYLYRNEGDGTFTNISDTLPVAVHDAHVFMTAWQDIDGDMWPELLTLHDFGWNRPSQLLWNQKGVLVADDPLPEGASFDIAFAGMGIGIGDVNGDDIPDFVQSSWKAHSLLLSETINGRILYFESAGLRQIPNSKVTSEEPDNQIFGWGTDFVDIDLDGDLDIVEAFGHWEEYQELVEKAQRDALFLQDDEGLFKDDVAESWELDDSKTSRGLVIADLNNDGWPDVVKRVLDGATKMALSRCGEGNWLRFRLHSESGNRFAVGARIKVIAGEDHWVRWIHAGSTSMFSGGPPEALFGLAGHNVADQIEITWPDGEVSLITNVGSNQIVDVTQLSMSR